MNDAVIAFFLAELLQFGLWINLLLHYIILTNWTG